jgi:glycosyltransferase involved in cell wall biosynthesis|tara:strand:+ start:804 stop:2018 length:1215 start_codon:yes stop_codon:yes gene_type:complete
MSKIKVLVVPSDRTGVGKFRSVDPHVFLQNLYGDDFHVDIMYEPSYDDMSFWSQYQIVAFHRSIGSDFERANELIQKLNSLGIITIADIDDYWMPGKEHPIHDIIKINKINEKIIANLKVATYVTTTTEIFANEIRKFNKNVVVFPNAINPNEPQFKEPTLESDRVRIGWLGGSSHLHDIELLNQSFGKITNLKDKLQFVLCGFDTRGSVTEINQQTGEHKKRDILPHETVWAQYEKIFTQNHKLVSDDYKNHLLKYTQETYPNQYDESYVRVWTQPVTSYAKNYSKFDVSLSPIKNTMFNRMKSQLKVIEAGFYKKAIIATNLGPYTIDLKHCLDHGNFVDGNAMLVDENRNHSDWAKYIKKLVDNPNMIKDMGERLYETVKDTYDLNVVTKNRAEFYNSLIK